MTNEEKAIEIGVKYQTPCHGVGDCEFEARQSALEMAQWKDEQFAAEKQALIDKACEWVKGNVHRYLASYGTESSDVCIEKASLIKDFRKAMEETK